MTTRAATPERRSIPDTIPHVLRFDGVDDYVDNSGLTSHFTGQTSVSFGCRVKLGANTTDSPNSQPIMETKYARLYGRAFGTRNTIRIRQDHGSASEVYLNTTDHKIGEWVDVVGVYEGIGGGKCNMYLYENGALVGTSIDQDEATIQFSNYIGRRAGATPYWFTGSIQRPFVVERVMTASEIAQLHLYDILPSDNVLERLDTVSDDGATWENPAGTSDATITGATRVTQIGSLPYMPRRSIVPYVGSVSFDGNDNVNIYSAGFVAAFNPAETTLVQDIYIRPDTIADGVQYYGIQLRADATNNYKIMRETDNVWRFARPGMSIGYASNKLGAGWHQFVLVASESGDYGAAYIDGIMIGRDSNIDAWSGALLSANTVIGAYSTSGTSGLKGNIASTRIYNRALTTAEVETLALHNTTPWDSDPTVCVLNLEGKTDLMSGSTWRDASGNGNHGTVSGATISYDAPTKERNPDPDNLVPNGDFRIRPYTVATQTTEARWIDGTAAGGTSPSGSAFKWAMTTLSAGATAEFDGNTLKLSTTDTGQTALASQAAAVGLNNYNLYAIPVKASTEYRLTYRMKTVRTSGTATTGAGILVSQRGGDGGAVAQTNVAGVITSVDWTTYTDTFTTNAACRKVYVRPTITNDGTATLIMDAWFADIRLVEVT